VLSDKPYNKLSTGDALLFYRISSSLLKGDGQLKISD